MLSNVIEGSTLPPVLILDLHYAGLMVARSLGRRGIPVFGIDKEKKPIGAKSRYVRRLRGPRKEEDLERILIDFSKKVGMKPVLFPMSDNYVLSVLKSEEVLLQHFHFPINSTATQSLISKTESAKIFEKMGIKTPKTIILKKGISSLPPLDGFPFPAILKPDLHDNWEENASVKQFLGGGKRVVIARDREELERTLGVLCYADDMVLQEFIPGPSETYYYFVGYRSRDGRVLAAYVGRKLRTLPDCLGSETVLISVHNFEILRVGKMILEKFDYVGPAGIDFKYDRRSGEFNIIEINCRLGMNDAYLERSGIDIAWIYYCDSQGIGVKEKSRYPEGVTWVDVFRDLDWMRTYSEEKNASWIRWFPQVLLRSDVHALFDWKDPGPFIEAFLDLTVRAAGKIVWKSGQRKKV